MRRAYVRVNIHPGSEVAVRNHLRTQAAVRSADLTAGQQDLVALVEGESFEAILDSVVDLFRSQEGVRNTTTNFILE